jgi:hypothetical protein
MKRSSIWLSDKQRSALKALAKRMGIPAAEIVRRFVDEGLEKEAGKAAKKSSRQGVPHRHTLTVHTKGAEPKTEFV